MARLSLAKTLPDFLSRSGIIYHAPGDATNTGLPDKSVDLYYSFAVLEHVPEATAARVIEEARRVLKPDGIRPRVFPFPQYQGEGRTRLN